MFSHRFCSSYEYMGQEEEQKSLLPRLYLAYTRTYRVFTFFLSFSKVYYTFVETGQSFLSKLVKWATCDV